MIRRPLAPRAGRWRDAIGRLFAALVLRATRRRVRGRSRWAIALGIAAVVGVASLWAGGMLTLTPVQGAYTIELLTGGGVSGWWFYPELLVVQPWGIVQLPWFPALAMLGVALGAGWGASASLDVLIGWFREPFGDVAGRRTVGVAGGAAPPIVSLATLGACCCTSCSSAAGLALVAAVSATSVRDLYALEWYLPLFQLAVVYLSLLAQERALRRPGSPRAERTSAGRARELGAAGLRIALLVAGVTWSLAMFVEWGSSDPLNASPAVWYHWLFEHQLLALAAIAAGLFPTEVVRYARDVGAPYATVALRAGLLVAGVTWGIGVPPALVALGLGGFGNELLGATTAAASPWAVGLEPALGPALLFHWAMQHLLLAGFGISLALAPSAVGWTLAVPSEAPERPEPST